MVWDSSPGRDKRFSWFQTFAMFWMLYAYFWVVPWCLNFICQRFGTLCLLAVRVSMGWHPMAHPDTHPVFFTYLPVASMWVVTLHSLFLYSDPPLPCHPPSYWLRLFSSQTFSHINAPTFLKPSHSSYLLAHENGTDRVFWNVSI